MTSPVPLKIFINDDDLSSESKAALRAAESRAHSSQNRLLGEQDGVERILQDLLPSLIAKRIRAITPPEFVVSEIELCVTIEGKIWGCGISGDMKVKLAPGRR